jgi:hypothetical protein
MSSLDACGSSQKFSDKALSVSLDTSSRSTWEAGVMPHLDDVPLTLVGKGEQNVIKIKLAMESNADSHLLLIEEAGNGAQRGEAVVLYIDTGADGSSPLVAYYDVLDNLPVRPNGDDIKWSMPSGIVKSQLPA